MFLLTSRNPCWKNCSKKYGRDRKFFAEVLKAIRKQIFPKIIAFSSNVPLDRYIAVLRTVLKNFRQEAKNDREKFKTILSSGNGSSS